MKKKILTLIFVISLISILTIGCKKEVGTPEDNAVQEEEQEGEQEEEDGIEDGTKFGYSCIDLDNPYYGVLQKAIEIEIQEEGYTLVVKNPGSDATLQNQQILEMIDEGVKAVFLCPVDREAIKPALEALDEADIPVINIDTQVKDESLTKAFIGSDNKNAGYQCGENLVKKLPKGGNVIIVENSTINSFIERITGFEKAIANAGFEIAERIDLGTGTSLKESIDKILTSKIKIDAVMCGNDQIALKVVDIFEKVGVKDVFVYGVDGSPKAKEKMLEEGSLMEGTGAQSPINIGKKAVQTLFDIMEGEEYKEEYLEDTFLINKDNVEMYGTNGWQ